MELAGSHREAVVNPLVGDQDAYVTRRLTSSRLEAA
jgi:hypothetical protein